MSNFKKVGFCPACKETHELDWIDDGPAYGYSIVCRVADTVWPEDEWGKLTQNVIMTKPILARPEDIVGGVKFDGDKIRYDLVPYDALDAVVNVLTFGAKKYADRNWEKGMDWGRCSGAALRHISAFLQGEDLDPESDLLHTAHAACCLLFLTAYQIRALGNDDRFLEKADEDQS